MAAGPAGARVRTRLRVDGVDAAVLGEVGWFLGSLAGRDLAARCREGRLDAAGQARSRQARKKALTAESSSRWAGAITRTSADQYRLAEQNLRAEQASLRSRVGKIQARLSIPVGGGSGRVRGYPSVAERHAKTVRLQTLSARMRVVESSLAAGRVHVVRGGRRLFKARNDLPGVGLTPTQWRDRWQAERMFLTADGERDKPWGNETIRWNPVEETLEVRLPSALIHLANRPHGRYRLSAPIRFGYRGDEVAAQAAFGAVRYDITHNPRSGRWYLDASWRTAPAPIVELEQLRQHRVVSVDVNDGHLAVAVLTPDGNLLGAPATIPLSTTGLPGPTRDARVRDAVSVIIGIARNNCASAVVIENLDFAAARRDGREHHSNRPSRGSRGRRFRRMVAGIPTGRFRDRLTQMTTNAGIAVIVVDPAYTTRWAAEHWLAPLRKHHPHASGHHAAALVVGRRGLGHRARRHGPANLSAPEEAPKVTARASGTIPAPQTTPQGRDATPRDGRQPLGTKTARTHQGPVPRLGGPRPFGATHQAGLTPAQCLGTVV